VNRPPVHPPTAHRPQLQIQVAGGVGAGPTEIAAFDAALRAVGTANYNLLPLSSVIPPGSVITTPSLPMALTGGWGDRLYVVIAEARTGVVGAEVWAGIGWIQDPQLRHGLLVEHEGHSEAKVISDIELSLAALRQGRGTEAHRLTHQQLLTAGVTCTDQPVCALVIAVFTTEPWRIASSIAEGGCVDSDPS